MLPRHVQTHLQTLLAHFPCVVLTGVRQCGKTTLLGSLAGDWQRFDMENAADRAQVLADPDLFLRLHADKLLIDEAQLAPPLFAALRVAIDRDRSRKGRFLLSGSSSPELVKQISESLAGRVARIEMAPLSLSEAWQLPPSRLYPLLAEGAEITDIQAAAAARLSATQVRDYWFQGGYPEPWLNPDETFRSLWARHYIDAYLLRDIGALFPTLNRDRFRQFIALLSQLSGSILNNADIARTLGISEPTVRDWLRIAHDTFLWRHVPAWDRSAAKQLVKHPKGYLRDSGLLHRLLRIADHDMLVTHPAVGKSWEGMVVETLLRGFENAGIAVEPFHYRTRGGAEIDLILEGQFGSGLLLPIEIKLTQHGDKRALRALTEFVAAHNCPLGLVINNDERPRWLDERVLAIPAAYL
ncbi:ATP-binding protein [Rhodoferax sp.]|uniref:ATP-binding protein n=1 Tax=Rhodoferax sp. TaxID=50421 RepID=UPI0027544B5D|nr:ATP-binding protein [Rhodoferax sp.]